MTMRTLYIVAKYEARCFLKYIVAKSSRIVGLIIGLVLFVLYVVGLKLLFDLSLIKEALRGTRDSIISGLTLFSFFLCLLAISLGFSIVTQIRKSQRERIYLLLQSPTSPKAVIFVFLLMNSIIVVLFYILMGYPPLIFMLSAMGISTTNIMLFILLLTYNVIGFSSLGSTIGMAYLRWRGKKRTLISLVGGAIFIIVYFQIFRPESINISLILAMSSITYSYFSPFRWVVSPLLYGYDPYVPIEIILAIATGTITIYFPTEYLKEKYMTGKITVVLERVIIRRKYGIATIYRLLGRQIGGIVNKELRILAREPAMLSGIIFILMMLVVMIVEFGYSDVKLVLFGALIGGTLVVVVAPMMILQVSLALERKNMGLLLSGPIEPSIIIRGKTFIADIIIWCAVGLTMMLLLVIGVNILHIFIFVITLINMALPSVGIAAYIATKYVDFKASNPRKALRTSGVLLLMAYITIIFIFAPLLLFIVLSLPPQIVVPCGLALIPLAYWLRRILLSMAGGILAELEATEYM